MVRGIQSLSMAMSLPQAIILVPRQSKPLSFKMAAVVVGLWHPQFHQLQPVSVLSTTQAVKDGPVIFGTIGMVPSMIVLGTLRALAAQH